MKCKTAESKDIPLDVLSDALKLGTCSTLSGRLSDSCMMPKTALVTGATGLLGRQVQKAFQDAGWDAIGTGFSRSGPSIRKLDLADASAVSAFLDEIKYESQSPSYAFE